MKITLTDATYNKSHDLLLITRGDEIVITTPDGVEIANLGLCVMTKPIENGADLPLEKSFFLTFQPVSGKLDKGTASYLHPDDLK
jgi:hypothetical protein